MREKTKHSTNFITVLVRKINRNIRYHSRNTKGQLFTRGITQTSFTQSVGLWPQVSLKQACVLQDMRFSASRCGGGLALKMRLSVPDPFRALAGGRNKYYKKYAV